MPPKKPPVIPTKPPVAPAPYSKGKVAPKPPTPPKVSLKDSMARRLQK